MTHTTPDPELPRGIALAWGVAASPRRGPKREMSVEQIVEVAVQIADSDGLEAVSMAAVAGQLGFTPMALYRYISAKDDLLLLMQEAAFGAPPAASSTTPSAASSATPPWRTRLEHLFHAQVEIYVRHPWVLSLPISGTPMTPNSSAWIEAGLAALDGTALSAQERLAVVLLITGQSRFAGSVMTGYAEQARRRGISDEAVAARESAIYARLVSAEQFPHLRQAIDDDVFISTADPFRFGLDRTLDGIESYLTSLEGNGE